MAKRTPRWLPLLLVFALVASACSALLGPDIETAAEESGTQDIVDDTPLFNPRDTDVPLSVDGGVMSGNTDDVVVTNSAGIGAADGSVQRAAGIWPTDWSRITIDPLSLAVGLGGSDTRDGIPPIDRPLFETVTQASQWMSADEPGALVRVDGEARFYPLAILTRHEIVNDRFGDIPIAVTYCPLCNTALAFDRRVDGEVLRLGVSGLLRQSDLVMWDEQTNSLWQQITGRGIVGEFAGTQLDIESTAIVSFGQFAADFPDGLSLSRETGFSIAYGANPYEGYSSSSGPIGAFFEGDADPRLAALERVVGVSAGDGGDRTEAAYAFARIQTERAINDDVGGEPVAILWSGDTADALDTGRIATGDPIGTAIALSPIVDGERLTFTANADGTFEDGETGSTWSVLGRGLDGPLAGEQLDTVTHRNEFWFAWAAFFPEGELRQ